MSQQPLSLQDYTIRKGDTLSSIANRYNLTPNFLASANSIKDPRKLQIGQKLIVAQAPQLSQPLLSPSPAAPAPASVVRPAANTNPSTTAAPSLQAGGVPHYLHPLLQVIRNAEANVMGYNTMVDSYENHNLINRTVQDVMDYQQAYRQKYKGRTGAAGAYQIMPGTFPGIISRMKLDPKTSIYNQQMQDRMAYDLLKYRGLEGYLQGKTPLSKIRVNIGKEWAGLPAVGSKSYYHGRGGNRANVSEKQYLDALRKIKQLYDSSKQYAAQ